MMQVKIFDFEHEKDLEDAVNDFLATVDVQQVIDIHYSVAVAESSQSAEMVFCFSAMVIYRQ